VRAEPGGQHCGPERRGVSTDKTRSGSRGARTREKGRPASGDRARRLVSLLESSGVAATPFCALPSLSVSRTASRSAERVRGYLLEPFRAHARMQPGAALVELGTGKVYWRGADGFCSECTSAPACCGPTECLGSRRYGLGSKGVRHCSMRAARD
jgi:hypothetical protein